MQSEHWQEIEQIMNSLVPSRRYGLAVMQLPPRRRGHRHSLHRRYCCLFLCRSELYLCGRALGPGCCRAKEAP